MINIYENKKVVFKKIILKNYFEKYPDYDDAFHGTSYKAL